MPVSNFHLTDHTRSERLADFAVAFFISALLLSIGLLLFVGVTVVLVHTFRWLF